MPCASIMASRPPWYSIGMAGNNEPMQSVRFLNGRLKYLITDDLSMAGFGAAHVDCVVLLRPTLSPGLYAFMAMPGLRLHPRKKNCLVLDFVGNALRHGPVDQFTTGMPAQRGQLRRRKRVP